MGEIKVCFKEKLPNNQTKVTGKIEEPAKVVKVLTMLATPCVKNVEVNSSEAKITGELYLTGTACLEDNSVVETNSSQPFTISVESAKIGQDSKLEVYCNKIDNVSTTVNNGEISISTIVNCDVYVLNCTIYNCAQAEEGIFVQETEIETNYIKEQGKHNFAPSIDVENGNIVLKSYNGIIKNVVASEEYFTISGEVVANVMYNDNGNIKNSIKNFNFSEEVSCAGINKEDVVHINIYPCLVPTVVAGEDKTTLELPFVADYIVGSKCKAECVADAYSLQNEINLTTQSIEQTQLLPNKYIEETIMSNFVVPEDITPVDRIMAVTGESINVINSYIKNEEGNIEGIATVNVVYKGEDENGEVINSVVVDIPFNVSFQATDMLDDVDIACCVIFGDISSKVRKGQIELVVQIKINCNLSRNYINAVVTEISRGEVKIPRDCALEIYVVKPNETLWDVGKNLNISTEDLINQNTDVALPLMGGEKLVVYRGYSS